VEICTHSKVVLKILGVGMVEGLHKLIGHAVMDVVQREDPVTQELVQIRTLKLQLVNSGTKTLRGWEFTLEATIALRQEAISAMANEV
jgi:hypothetical protein